MSISVSSQKQYSQDSDYMTRSFKNVSKEESDNSTVIMTKKVIDMMNSINDNQIKALDVQEKSSECINEMWVDMKKLAKKIEELELEIIKLKRKLNE